MGVQIERELLHVFLHGEEAVVAVITEMETEHEQQHEQDGHDHVLLEFQAFAVGQRQKGLPARLVAPVELVGGMDEQRADEREGDQRHQQQEDDGESVLRAGVLVGVVGPEIFQPAEVGEQEEMDARDDERGQGQSALEAFETQEDERESQDEIGGEKGLGQVRHHGREEKTGCRQAYLRPVLDPFHRLRVVAPSLQGIQRHKQSHGRKQARLQDAHAIAAAVGGDYCVYHAACEEYCPKNHDFVA